jgi:hypothetical protein
VPRAHVGTLLVVLALAAWTWDVLASFFVLRRSRNSYALRPDTVETFVYLWCLTRDSVWRERGWRIVRGAAAPTRGSPVSRAHSRFRNEIECYGMNERKNTVSSLYSVLGNWLLLLQRYYDRTKTENCTARATPATRRRIAGEYIVFMFTYLIPSVLRFTVRRVDVRNTRGGEGTCTIWLKNRCLLSNTIVEIPNTNA